jgi:hypothetical protein
MKIKQKQINKNKKIARKSNQNQSKYLILNYD